MKKILFISSCLTVFLAVNAVAAPISCASVSCSPNNPVVPVISQYEIASSGYTFQTGALAPGFSWGGVIQFSPNNKFVLTAVCCQDADQFFLVTNNKGQSCYLDSDESRIGTGFQTLVYWPTGGAKCVVMPAPVPNNYSVIVNVVQ